MLQDVIDPLTVSVVAGSLIESPWSHVCTSRLHTVAHEEADELHISEPSCSVQNRVLHFCSFRPRSSTSRVLPSALLCLGVRGRAEVDAMRRHALDHGLIILES